MAPVAPPSIKKGDDARVLALRLAGKLRAANDRLEASRDWYSRVVKSYAD